MSAVGTDKVSTTGTAPAVPIRILVSFGNRNVPTRSLGFTRFATALACELARACLRDYLPTHGIVLAYIIYGSCASCGCGLA
jgi:hypothetical protein